MLDCTDYVCAVYKLWVFAPKSQICCILIRCKSYEICVFFCTHNMFIALMSANVWSIVWNTYSDASVLFVISLMCFVCFYFCCVHVNFMQQNCEFSQSFCTTVFCVVPCKILHLHLLHMGAAETGCKDSASQRHRFLGVKPRDSVIKKNSIINISNDI